MLKTRVITAILGVGVMIAAVTLGGAYFDVLLWALAMLAWNEFTVMLKKAKFPVVKPLGMAFTTFVMGFVYMQQYVHALAIAFASLFILFVWNYIALSNKVGLIKVGSTLLGMIYITGGFTAMQMIRSEYLYSLLPHIAYPTPAIAISLIWIMLLSTWASDTFAYFAGSAWGKHKIVPKISPNKSLEGFIGGFVGCIFTAIIASFFFGVEVYHGAMLGVIVGICAPLGDLFESKLKRDCGVKDSGMLLPGHGGVLDRFDSLLFVAPFILLYLIQL